MSFARGAGIALALLVSAPAYAQQPTPAQADAIRSACRSDFMSHCRGVTPGGAEALQCLKQNAAQSSAACQSALAAVGGGAAAAPQAAPATAPAAPAAAPRAAPAKAAAPAAPAVDQWPHTITTANGAATVYQPQVISWPDQRVLNTRGVVGVTPAGAKQAMLGTVEISFTTAVDLPERTVILTEPRLVSAKFPTLDDARNAQLQERIREVLSGLGVKRVPVAMVTASLAQSAQKPPEVAIENSPPVIFASARPASLVVFDGPPVLAPIANSTLSSVVNTNWDVFQESRSKTWFLLLNGGWLAAPEAKGPWVPAGALPPAFAALPADGNFANVKKQIPGRRTTAADTPVVYTSQVPAAIIVTNGPPQWTNVPGTSLQYAANSDAALFRDQSQGGKLYYLVSGRWFSAATLAGPWSFATTSLPADFARIPANGPRGFVLVSVPGTPQAQEALLEAQIPQQATLDRSAAKMTVVYAGEPVFAPIPGTTLAYATNTSFVVVRESASYYSCYQGAWFVAGGPNGPWVLTETIPSSIYAIPPSSPVYPCTYVRVYASTPTSVTYGYTPGYTMSYVSAGVVVYGTGYYYPPYIYPAYMPIYYPYPYSYAGATYYNPATGAWAHGGAIYGPWGGAAKGGSYYNPTTGTYARGGEIYGPNGGAGAFSAYNPSTGSYAHGSAAWGPDGGTGNASWYNANTGRSGTTNQNSNQYGRWGSSTISGPNQTVHTQSQGDSRGNVGSFSSSSGARGAGFSGADGNKGGVVQGSGGNVYAGADGNVYKKTDSGWEKYTGTGGSGTWQPVDPQSAAQSRTNSGSQNLSGQTQGQATEARSQNLPGATQGQGAQARSQNLSGETQRGGGFAQSFGGQLENDHAARMGGQQRYQQFGAQRGGYGGGGGRFRR